LPGSLGQLGQKAVKQTEERGDSFGSAWNMISHCIMYMALAFFIAVISYYIMMTTYSGAGHALIPSSGK